jgi:3-oxoacid CoA-transferase
LASFIFQVDRIVPATVKSKIDILKTATDPKNTTEKGGEDQVAGLNKQKDPARLRRERIARRAAKEIKDGYYCNLGVGMPTLSVDYLEPGIQVWLQSENGILGMGPYPTPNQVDP